MKKLILTGLLLAGFGVTAAFAGVIEDRQDVMKQLGGTGRVLGPMVRDPSAYNAATANAQLQIIVDASAKIPTLFPAGSDTGPGPAKTLALPTVRSDRAGFAAAAAKLGADAKAAMAATDGATFAVAYRTVQGDCNACHTTYRAQPPRPAGPPPGAAPAQ